jgi:hypothetical protein
MQMSPLRGLHVRGFRFRGLHPRLDAVTVSRLAEPIHATNLCVPRVVSPESSPVCGTDPRNKPVCPQSRPRSRVCPQVSHRVQQQPFEYEYRCAEYEYEQAANALMPERPRSGGSVGWVSV